MQDGASNAMAVRALTGFNEIIALCQQLDAAHSNINENKSRHTTLYIKRDSVLLRIANHDRGVITDIAMDFYPSDDMALEIRSAHQVIDDRLRKHKCIADMELKIPF